MSFVLALVAMALTRQYRLRSWRRSSPRTGSWPAPRPIPRGRSRGASRSSSPGRRCSLSCSPWLWPVIVGLSTGIPDAYNGRWRLGGSRRARLKIGIWWDFLYLNYGIAGQVLGPLVVIAFTWFMLSRHSWRWGPEIWGWARRLSGIHPPE